MTHESTKATCSVCGKTADVSKDPHAWDGWLFTDQGAICPSCSTNDKGEIELSKVLLVERLR